MTRRNPPAKWALPDEIDPVERLCFMVPVPKNRQHIAAFKGALLELARWYSWQEDSAHTASAVANVWKDIYDHVTVTDCVTGETLHGMEIEELMPIRVDCDCRVWITCCDGTEKELVTVGMVPNLSQAPGGEEPNGGKPKPGGSVTNCYTLDANGYLNLPFTVSPGDVIEVTSATGAGWDGDPLRSWACPDGKVFFAGTCSGNMLPSGSDPVPSIQHMRLIWNIGGSSFDAMAGPVTVGGSGEQQLLLSVNDSNLADNSGSYQVCVKVTSAAAAAWSHTFDFALTDGGFGNYGSYGDPSAWIPGQGWHYDTFVACNCMAVRRAVASTNFTRTTITLDYAGTVNATGSVYTPSGSLVIGVGHTSGVQTFVVDTTPAAQTFATIGADGVIASSGGSVKITKVVFEGTGVDPF